MRLPSTLLGPLVGRETVSVPNTPAGTVKLGTPGAGLLSRTGKNVPNVSLRGDVSIATSTWTRSDSGAPPSVSSREEKLSETLPSAFVRSMIGDVITPAFALGVL